MIIDLPVIHVQHINRLLIINNQVHDACVLCLTPAVPHVCGSQTLAWSHGFNCLYGSSVLTVHCHMMAEGSGV